MSINITQVCTGRDVGQAELLPFFGQYQYVAIHYGKTPSHTDTHTGRRREGDEKGAAHDCSDVRKSEQNIIVYKYVRSKRALAANGGWGGGRDAGEGT